MKPVKLLFMLVKIVIILVLLAVGYVVFVLLFATLTEHQPQQKEDLSIHPAESTSKKISSSDTLTALIWNIGYCGLGAEMDFFYDGGQTVVCKKEWHKKYLQGVLNNLNTRPDFVLLQEVDKGSKRSHFSNQAQVIADDLKSFSHSFAYNYRVNFIPIPFTNPMGKVRSGLMSLSRFLPVEAARHQFPGKYSWPNRVFFLKRCFLLQRFQLDGSENELVIINTHNSAYDDGSLKAAEMAHLREILLTEYEKGNYVLVGGDWNQIPSGFNNLSFEKAVGQKATAQLGVKNDYLQGWTWAYDPKAPTNRKLSAPYDKDKTFTTVIDFYLLSPNLEVLEVKTDQLHFEFSDHQPVYLSFRFK